MFFFLTIKGAFPENLKKKFENEREDRFLVILKISEKIGPGKFAVHTFVSDYKYYIISKII